ncbi:MAG: GNAT family N-acetyltransferase [Candidatus Lokiarchaeota archaeon]|nr:GNAT family N-acetyltransferase [Candidatus Lokiarchaeota archaeon]
MLIQIASLDDVSGVHQALMQNLIEIRDFDKITEEQRELLEKKGFLRKEVDKKYYKKLVENPYIDIYIAKEDNGVIIGFASIHRHIYDVRKVRDVLGNLITENTKSRELLLNEDTEFAYLDQISILPDYQRKGIGTMIFKKALQALNTPIVAFIVEIPIKNLASIYWHEHNGFVSEAISDGEYKGKSFKFLIYVNWNTTN